MKKLILLLFVFISFINFTNAQWWTFNYGLTYDYSYHSYGNITSLAISEHNIFAGTQYGVFVSNDTTGNGWMSTDLHISSTSGPYLSSFAVSSGNNVFAGSWGGNGSGIFLSSNNGTQWSAVMPYTNVQSLAASGTNIFAGIINKGIFLSNNNGASWDTVNNGLPYDNIYHSYPTVNSFAISGNNIFAGTDNNGIFLSTNNGASWTPVSNGLPFTYGTDYCRISALAISGTNIFAGINNHGIFLSSDNGANWTAVNNGLTTVNNGLTIPNIFSFAVSGTKIFAGSDGVFLSTNNGNSWIDVSYGLFPDLGVLSLAIRGQYIYAGSQDGIWTRPLSEMTAVENISANNNDFSIYPNPATNQLTLNNLSLNSNQDITVLIINVLGEIIQEEKLKWSNDVNISISNLSSGMYFLQMKSEQGSFVGKFAKE